MSNSLEEQENRRGRGTAVPPPPTQHGLSKWIVTIHGKEAIRYQGLLAMAHEQGLVELKAEFISVTDNWLLLQRIHF